LKQLTDWRGRQWCVELRDFREFNQLQNLAHKKVEIEVEYGKRGLRERRRPAKTNNNSQKTNKKCSKSHDFEHFYL
jgi:hypothetical protein